MAEPTYTMQRDCTQCGHEITMAGVSFPGTSRAVTVRWVCPECGSTGDEVIERRAIPGQPGYGEAPPPVKLVPGSVAWKAETTFGTSPRPSDAVLKLTAVSGMSDGSPPPAPADEWSKPVKDEHGSFEAQLKRGGFVDRRAKLEDGDLMLEGDEFAWAPRDVVLRLLAAEASDRLGWVWEVVRYQEVLSAMMTAPPMPPSWSIPVWQAGESRVIADFEGGPAIQTPDELLAAQHGYFLLQDALREAGQ